MNVVRFAADRRGRELRTIEAHGLVVVALYEAGRCISGPLAVPLVALEALRSALADPWLTKVAVGRYASSGSRP